MTIKSNKIVFICLNFLQKLPNLKAETMFHTRSNLLCFVSVGVLSVSSLLHNVFFIVWEHDVWYESTMACRTK